MQSGNRTRYHAEISPLTNHRLTVMPDHHAGTQTSNPGGSHANLYQGVAEQDGLHHHGGRPGYLDFFEQRIRATGLPGMAQPDIAE